MPAFRAALANQAVLKLRMPLSASDTARGWHPELARASPARLAGGRGTIRDDQAAATVAFTILSGERGGSPLLIVSTTSMPSTTLPHTVYCLSRKRASSKQMKNCEFAECGKLVRAIEQVPRTCGSALNSAFRSGRSEPPEPVPVGSPVW